MARARTDEDVGHGTLASFLLEVVLNGSTLVQLIKPGERVQL